MVSRAVVLQALCATSPSLYERLADCSAHAYLLICWSGLTREPSLKRNTWLVWPFLGTVQLHMSFQLHYPLTYSIGYKRKFGLARLRTRAKNTKLLSPLS